MEQSSKKFIKILIGLAVIVVILAIIGVIENPFSRGNQGAVVLNKIGSDENVFIDGVVTKNQKTQGGRLVYVMPGRRDILISKEGYWPWLKQVLVEENLAKQLSPFFFMRVPLLEEITNNDSKYNDIIAKTLSPRVPSSPRALVSDDTTVSVWKEGNSLKALWMGKGEAPSFFCLTKCVDLIEFSKIEIPLRQILFMPNRNDVVFMITDTDIFALELNQEPIQNFQLVYSAKVKPTLVIHEKMLYVYDDGKLFLLKDQ